jgi:hypothetical protein
MAVCFEDDHEFFKAVHSVHCSVQCSQFIVPTKCTVLFTYECYIYRNILTMF